MPSDTAPGIFVKNVTKKYGPVTALDNVSVRFEPGKIYGLLGRNGAGKTTLLNIITNRVFADSGEVILDNRTATENDRAQERIYLMSESTLYNGSLRINDVFRLTKSFYPKFDSEEAVRNAGLFKINLKTSIKSLSTGYRSIFKAIIALSVNADYAIFDEPVLGLDANHRDLFYRLLIEKYSVTGCTAILSTHLIEEVSSIVEHVVLIHNGRILRDQSKDELLSSGYSVSGAASAVDMFIKGREIIGVSSLGGLKTACALGPRPEPERLPPGVEISPINLQDLFIRLTDTTNIPSGAK